MQEGQQSQSPFLRASPVPSLFDACVSSFAWDVPHSSVPVLAQRVTPSVAGSTRHEDVAGPAPRVAGARKKTPKGDSKARPRVSDVFDSVLDAAGTVAQKKQRHNSTERARIVRLGALFSELAAELGMEPGASKGAVLQKALCAARQRRASLL